MAEGFILDSADGAGKVARWVEGPPVRGWWSRFGYVGKLGKKAKYEIQTWRCIRCGFLDSYAKG